MADAVQVASAASADIDATLQRREEAAAHLTSPSPSRETSPGDEQGCFGGTDGTGVTDDHSSETGAATASSEATGRRREVTISHLDGYEDHNPWYPLAGVSSTGMDSATTVSLP